MTETHATDPRAARKRILWSLSVVLLVGVLLFLTLPFGQSRLEVKRIAHAGGGIADDTYTNSLEALTHNRKKGFDFFEIDFNWTADDQLVCIHDWDNSPRELFGVSLEKNPTLAEFRQLVREQSRYRLLSLSELAVWMLKNPGVVLVTDIKRENIKGLHKVREAIPDHARRVIPQVHTPGEYNAARDLGYEQIIWTLYRYRGDLDDILEQVGHMDLFAVTMPKSRARDGVAKALGELGIPTYLHTVNSVDEAQMWRKEYGIDEFYTDFMPPGQTNAR